MSVGSSKADCPTAPQSNVGAGLLANAVCQSIDSLADTPHSRASRIVAPPLPHLVQCISPPTDETCPHPAPAQWPTHQTPPATADHLPTYCRCSPE
ncbi:MAG TPA: hypothetical protein ENI30_13280 [Gammaproteobacteria bacterium]|nr:hypothetical protein [Gammaproteobacteria bacterium]